MESRKCVSLTFLTIPPHPSSLSPKSWDTQTGLGQFLPSGVLHCTARGDSSTISSKVSVPKPTWHRGQRETHQPQQHQAYSTQRSLAKAAGLTRSGREKETVRQASSRLTCRQRRAS